MNRLLRDEQDQDDTRDYERIDTRRGQQAPEREISLGTTMLIGIFFAIALLCAVFFGFGYSLGSRHAAPVAVASTSEPSGSPFSSFKPSPFGSGSTAPSNSAKPAYSAPADVPPPPTVTVRTPAASKPAPIESDSEPAPTPAPIVRQPPPAAAIPAPASLASSPNSFVVQIAAVSHQEDADLLVSTLKRRGYAVAIHQEPQDHLLHVQVSPFAIRKDADAMRQRLLNDGFNAIVK